MLTITIPSTSFFNEATEEFLDIKGTTLQMEHSLVSLTKWESKWHKPFLSKTKKTKEEIIDYYRCMTITQNVNPLIYLAFTSVQTKEIDRYLEDPMTATTISGQSKTKRTGGIVTAELIYYKMVVHQIPFDPCEKWHLNRLLMLIQVCDEKNQKPRKMSAKEAAAQRYAQNATRRAELNSKG